MFVSFECSFVNILKHSHFSLPHLSCKFPAAGTMASLDTPWAFSAAAPEEAFCTYVPCGLCTAHGAEAWLGALGWRWGLPGSGPWCGGRGWERGRGKLGEAPERGVKAGREGDHSHLHHLKSAVSAKPGRCPPGLGLCPERTAQSGHRKSPLQMGTTVSKGLLL